MTGQLRATMQTRADALDGFDLDLDAIVHAGDRRARRRRTALVGGVAGALSVAVGMAGLTGRHTTQAAPQPVDGTAQPLTYAVGSVIHDGDTTVDVGQQVASMVQTVHGFVFSTPDLGVYVEHDGDVQPIGHLAEARDRLIAGDDGLIATWWDGTYIQTWPLAYGIGVRHTVDVADSWPSNAQPHVEALSDGHLWFWKGHDTWVAAVQPTPSTAEGPDPGLEDPNTVQDAAGDRLLVRVSGGMAVTPANLRPLTVEGLQSWEPGVDVSHLQPQVRNVVTGDLSPDGDHWFTQDADQFAVFDSQTGHRQDVAHPGFAFAAPYQWLGNDTIAALALRTKDDESVSLLTCRVSTGSCEVAAPDVGSVGNVVVADGRPLETP